MQDKRPDFLEVLYCSLIICIHLAPCAARFVNTQLKMCVSLLPSDIGDIYAGIRRNIYQFLMRYNESLGGVLLAVSDLSFCDDAQEGRIEDEMPHIHFDVKAKAQVFRPRPGHVLEGRVNKVRCWLCLVEWDGMGGMGRFVQLSE